MQRSNLWFRTAAVPLVAIICASCSYSRGIVSLKYIEPEFKLDGPVWVKNYIVVRQGHSEPDEGYALVLQKALSDVDFRLTAENISGAKYYIQFTQTGDSKYCLHCERIPWERRGMETIVYRDTSDIDRVDNNVPWKARIFRVENKGPDKLMLEMHGCGSAVDEWPSDQFIKEMIKRRILPAD